MWGTRCSLFTLLNGCQVLIGKLSSPFSIQHTFSSCVWVLTASLLPHFCLTSASHRGLEEAPSASVSQLYEGLGLGTREGKWIINVNEWKNPGPACSFMLRPVAGDSLERQVHDGKQSQHAGWMSFPSHQPVSHWGHEPVTWKNCPPTG